MYVITGATGHTGRPIAEALLAAGKQVRIISRHPEKAADLVSKGAELFVGELQDIAFLQRAFAGARAVYCMIPPNLAAPNIYAYQQATADAITKAVSSEGVQHVVTLSSVGTHLSEYSGIVYGLRYLEQKLDAIPGLHRLHLRPTYFMENTMGMIPVIKTMNAFGTPVRGDLKISMIASRDIAAYAAKRLIALDFVGHNIQYLLGPRDVTYAEVAKVLCAAVGKPDIVYQQFPIEMLRAGMMQMGASENTCDSMIAFTHLINEGRVTEDATRDAESTTPTTIEDFARDFVEAYHAEVFEPIEH